MKVDNNFENTHTQISIQAVIWRRHVAHDENAQDRGHVHSFKKYYISSSSRAYACNK